MKIVKEMVKVPEEEYEQTSYVCEVCNESFWNDEDHDSHYAKEHAVKGEREVAGYKFLRFETADDYRLFHQQDSLSAIDICYRENLWAGPGWYGLKSWEEPCRRGCCTNYFQAAFHAASLAAQEREEAAKLRQKAAKCEETAGKFEELLK